MIKRLISQTNLLTLLFLVLIIIVLNNLIFSHQLQYGFRDVDWQVLYYFKLFGKLSLNHLFEEIKVLGVYISESYYVGLLVKFIGLNFSQLHLMTHFFKIIAAVGVYFLTLKIFRRQLLAFTSSLLYSISYTHAGVLFQLSSGGYFLTTTFMCSFLIAYYYSLYKSILKWSLVSSILLIISLLLKPERMYPLIALVFLVEFFIITKGKFRKELLIASFKRMFLIFLPIIFFSTFSHALFKGVSTGFAPNQFSVGVSARIDSIINGNLQLLIYPFASLGSIFLYDDYWKLLGQLNFQNFGLYILSLSYGPILRLGVVTFSILLLIYKKLFKIVLIIMTLVFLFGLVIYLLYVNWQHVDSATRIHFDPNFIALPAIFGFYILTLGLVFFFKWISTKDLRLAPMVVGVGFAYLFIILTWISSDLQLVFMGPQRYLSIPSIGTSLFISGLLVIVFDRLRIVKPIKHFAWIIFLMLVPLITINYQVAYKFFDYELSFAGLKGTDQTRMKDNFRQLVGPFDKQNKSLFYFDETSDKDNGYFDEGTVMAGFEYWTRGNMDGSLNYFPDPGMIRTNIQCPEHTHQNCMSILKNRLAVVNGRSGVWYKDPIRGNKDNFYLLSNFYAFRFINKNIVDVRQEVLRELNDN